MGFSRFGLLTAAGVAAIAGLPVTGAWAQDARAPDWRVTIGAGALVRPDYEGSDDFKVLPLPLLSLNYRDMVIVQGPSVAVNIVSMFDRQMGRRISFGPIARYYIGRDQDDNSALRGLGDVDAGIEGGAFIGYDAGAFGGKLTVVQDLSSGHDGTRAEALVSYRTAFSPRLRGNIEAGTTWASDDYMQSYFGVTPAQSVASGYAVRSAGAGFKDVSLSFGLNYALTERWGLFSRVGYTRLLGDAADSAIVESQGSANQISGGLGISYTF